MLGWIGDSFFCLFLPGASYTEGQLIPANENFPAKELHHTGERRSLIEQPQEIFDDLALPKGKEGE